MNQLLFSYEIWNCNFKTTKYSLPKIAANPKCWTNMFLHVSTLPSHQLGFKPFLWKPLLDKAWPGYSNSNWHLLKLAKICGICILRYIQYMALWQSCHPHHTPLPTTSHLWYVSSILSLTSLWIRGVIERVNLASWFFQGYYRQLRKLPTNCVVEQNSNEKCHKVKVQKYKAIARHSWYFIEAKLKINCNGPLKITRHLKCWTYILLHDQNTQPWLFVYRTKPWIRRHPPINTPHSMHNGVF